MIERQVKEWILKVKPLDDQPVLIMPATNEELENFERFHDFVLPSEVKSWLRQCNGASINPGGFYSLFGKDDDDVSIDWHLNEFPDWKRRGWIPIAGDGCGDVYILDSSIFIPSTGTHPVFFLDQADYDMPNYVVASGLWKFLFFILENEIRRQQGLDAYWPFEKVKVVVKDPQIVECPGIPMPWEP